ncbi:MAG TPA: DNA-3-methyladenine glycosylase [Thermoprotei archaeon]|nr:DNA-3-methyladenine glycosylase [Thermoprotei archaeon]
MRISRNYGQIIEKSFYEPRPDIVAKKILGKILLRIEGDILMGGMITEVEAYFGPEDPASRASKKGWIGEAMKRDPGYTLVYMVHGYWLLNIVTTLGGAGAVLIRGIEPLIGIEHMRRYRGVFKKNILTSGPGRLTRALNITKELDNIPVYNVESCIQILDYLDIDEYDIERSHRIGVSKDLHEPYRFYIKSFIDKGLTIDKGLRH